MNVDEAVRRNNLNENEIRIFREIMRCIDNKEYKATVRQIAKAAYVSTASVVRLAQKLGYLGYGDMMISLKNERTLCRAGITVFTFWELGIPGFQPLIWRKSWRSLTL